MKIVSLGILALVFAVFLTSCQTAPAQSLSNVIHNPVMQFTALTPSDYTVLGRVSGSGTVIHNTLTNRFSGDVNKHGSLNILGLEGTLSHGTVDVGAIARGAGSGRLQVPQTQRAAPPSARDIAIGSATYGMIEKANLLNADAVIFVTTSIEAVSDIVNRTITTTAVVSGLAIKIKQ